MRKLSESDLKLLQDAHNGLNTARTVLNFVQRHIVETYKVQKEEVVDLQTGELRKAEPDANGK